MLARRLLSPVLLVTLAVGCKATRQEQLEGVAKDWCLTIRASQVMPVYPLTQDLQPGDVFLVQLPIDEQQSLWKRHGYLPLDNHLCRIDPEGYGPFYDTTFPVADGTSRPLDFLTESPAWRHAPHAGFPSYSFSVKSGGGLNLAIPINAVPVGLGLLSADAAEGTVSIGDARTLGIDIVSLDGQLRRWAEDDGRDFLAGFASTSDRRNYVRVVTRVYLTGKLDVSLRDTSQRSGGLDVSVPSPVATLMAKLAQSPADVPQAAATSYKDAIDELNGMLARQDRYSVDASGNVTLNPGGSLRVTSASARAISMSETFDPPLVIGYLGYDCEIGPGGSLGPPVPSYALLAGELGGEAFLARNPVSSTYGDQLWVASYEIAVQEASRDARAKDAVAACDALVRFVPPSWTRWQLGPDGVLQELSSTPTGSGYEAFRAWYGSLSASASAIRDGLDDLPREVQRAGGTRLTVEAGSAELDPLRALADGFTRTADNPDLQRADSLAHRALADWIFQRLYQGRPE